MKGYRDAFYPPASPEHQAVLSPAENHADILPEGLTEGQDEADLGPDTANRRETSGRGSSQPLFDRPDDDGPDFDELLAMEEMEREQAAEPTLQEVREARMKAVERGGEANSHTRNETDFRGDGPPPALEEEDEWEGLYN